MMMVINVAKCRIFHRGAIGWEERKGGEKRKRIEMSRPVSNVF